MSCLATTSGACRSSRAHATARAFVQRLAPHDLQTPEGVSRIRRNSSANGHTLTRDVKTSLEDPIHGGDGTKEVIGNRVMDWGWKYRVWRFFELDRLMNRWDGVVVRTGALECGRELACGSKGRDGLGTPGPEGVN